MSSYTTADRLCTAQHPHMRTSVFQSSRLPPTARLPRSRVITCSTETASNPATSSGRGDGGGRSGDGRGGRSGGKRPRTYRASDGQEHLGSALDQAPPRPFPGPPPGTGPPLRVLPIGGLGEIGMNCMLVGVHDRYILIDAGLMFPDFQDLGMQKILPDTSFLAQWRDKIEAVVITHGHEDHIGALPWVVPALDPATPIYAGSFVHQLVQRRLQEYNLYDPQRFKTFKMRERFSCGPFEVEPIRVTHSIPDCCGLVLRSEHGTIVHTGDWKIDEAPTDGEQFDRETFEMLGREPVALMMSDSTNVLSPGRTTSESTVQDAIMRRVLEHQGKGRVVCTQFASNLHRLVSVKKAADAAGRKVCFIGMSLTTYLEAAWRDGRAPFNPREVISSEQLSDYDPNEVLIVTTGSQAEPRAALSLASNANSQLLKIRPSDLVLYSAKVIPGNEGRVTRMLNSLSELGARVIQGRGENLHTSGHAYQDELTEVLRYVKPQHFLPVHGEYAFLCEHARLAKEQAGVTYTQVIKNGQMLGVHERASRNQVSSSSMALLGSTPLVNFYNDGFRGTGTAQEMAINERSQLAFEGIVVVAVDVYRSVPGAAAALPNDGTAAAGRSQATLGCAARITTRGMWLGKGALISKLHRDVEDTVTRLPVDSSLTRVERSVIDTVRRGCRIFNNKKPEIICIAYEHDPRTSHLPLVAAQRRQQRDGKQAEPQQQQPQPLQPTFRRRSGDSGWVTFPPQDGGAAGAAERGDGAAQHASRPAAAATANSKAAKPWERPTSGASESQTESRKAAQSASGEPSTSVAAAQHSSGRMEASEGAAAAAAAAPKTRGRRKAVGNPDDDGAAAGEAAASSSTSKSTQARRRVATADADDDGEQAGMRRRTRTAGRSQKSGRGPPPLQPVPAGMMEDMRRANPREAPTGEQDLEYG